MAPGSILVLGLGELGEEIVKSLANHPERGSIKVAVLLRSRKPEQLAQLDQWKVEAVLGDVAADGPDRLQDVFRAFHTVICCTGMYLSPATQIKIVRAALAAGVKRYFPWQFGVDYDTIGRGSGQDLFDSQLDVRDLLRQQSAMQWVIVSTGMFIPFLFEPAFGLVSADRCTVTAIGSWENKITVTDPEDIGKVTAEIAIRHMGISGVVFASSDTISMTRLADIVEQSTRKKVDRKLRTVEDLTQELAEHPSDYMCKYRVVFGRGIGVSWPKSASFNARHAIATKTVDDWASLNLAS